MNVSFGPTTRTPSRARFGIRVEQPRRAVQADRRLAGSRPALDDERALDVARDQLVLVRRDRRDDLAHLADALARDVLDDRLGEVILACRQGIPGRHGGPGAAGHERLVDEAEHAAILDVEPPAARQPVRIARRRRVERLGGRRPPVDREQLVVRAPDGMAADVERVAVLRVDAPEVQGPAGLGVDADPLAPHLLERLVGEVVDAAAPPTGQGFERGVVGGAASRRGAPARRPAPPSRGS